MPSITVTVTIDSNEHVTPRRRRYYQHVTDKFMNRVSSRLADIVADDIRLELLRNHSEQRVVDS